jgi:tetratricopeptide (TPR) repeat protein
VPASPGIAEAIELHRSKRLPEAEVLYRALLESNPLHQVARLNLAQILTRTGRCEDAVRMLAQLLQDTPEHPAVLKQLGVAYAASAQLKLSLSHFQRALAHAPSDPDALQFVANLQQEMGMSSEAECSYRRALALRPLVSLASTGSAPTFRVLLLFAPGAGNTPFEYLVENAPFECHILNLLPSVDYDTDSLRERVDLVVNLVADADQAAALLGPAIDLIDRLGKPTVNDPRKIAGTDRESMALRLCSIRGCSVPQTRRHTDASLRTLEFQLRGTAPGFPILARPTGTHGGERFEKLSDPSELEAFVRQCKAPAYYLTQYIDYRSDDGFFRKYRFFFVGDRIHPYHLAIDDKWKIHHATTDMANRIWMQQEEMAFLRDPQTVFRPAAYDALRAIQKAVGLDYFGIDCALDREGRVVVFEVNACMLAHGRNIAFPYKAEPVRRIRDAFHTLLKRKVRLPRLIHGPHQFASRA